jgi:hypothetical protein
LAVLKIKLESVASLIGNQPDLVVQDVTECIRLTDDSIKEVRERERPTPIVFPITPLQNMQLIDDTAIEVLLR